MKTVADWAGRVTSYDYDAAGNLVKTTRPDGSVLSETYDNTNRLISMNDVDANNNIIDGYAYTYDAEGKILTETSSDGQTTSTMTYDADGRLTSRQDKDSGGNVTASHTYIYDAAGNVTSSDGTGMTYDIQDRLISYNGQSITYDADGNMTGGLLNGAAAAFSYDSGNRLVQADDTAYAYDAEDNRIFSTTSGQTTTYAYDTEGSLSQLLVATEPDGKNTYYVYGIGLVGAESTDGSYSAYHYDYRGSTTAITDGQGAVTDRYTYDAYGKLLSHTGTSNTPFLYDDRDGV